MNSGHGTVPQTNLVDFLGVWGGLESWEVSSKPRKTPDFAVTSFFRAVPVPWAVHKCVAGSLLNLDHRRVPHACWLVFLVVWSSGPHWGTVKFTQNREKSAISP